MLPIPVAFAFLAGLLTAVSPCVLPVLPLALSAGATGGPRRPLGVATGLAVSFTFAAVALVYAIDALGLPDGLLRTLAIAALIAFGAALLVPAVAARVEARLSRLTARLAPAAAARERSGFGGGLLVGACLGFVYAPCAGPVLAGVITVSAAQPLSAGRLLGAAAYGAGSALGLYALTLGGRRVARRLARHTARAQQALGAVMVVVAGLMLAGADVRVERAVATGVPAFLSAPDSALEASLGPPARAHPQPKTTDTSGLPAIGPAPPITGTQRWFNTPGDRPLTLAAVRREHRVVLVDFWTYSCINCIRTLPHVRAWDARYRSQGLTIIGVHTPELTYERDAGNVASAIADDGLRYPVVQDNAYATWNAYGNRFWPAEYLVDAHGVIRYEHIGEGAYAETERAIRSLLRERYAPETAPQRQIVVDPGVVAGLGGPSVAPTRRARAVARALE